jgi:hypothetical protein
MYMIYITIVFKILWQIYKHLSAIVHDILIASLSFYIHLGYYKKYGGIHIDTDLYQYFYKWLNISSWHKHIYKPLQVCWHLDSICYKSIHWHWAFSILTKCQCWMYTTNIIQWNKKNSQKINMVWEKYII